MGLESLKSGAAGISTFVSENPLATGLTLGGVGVATGLGAAALINSSRKSSSSRRTGKRIKHTKRGWAQDRKRRSKQKWEVAYRKRKSRSRNKKVYYARKTGQPYIKLANGKAKFIKGKRRLR